MSSEMVLSPELSAALQAAATGQANAIAHLRTALVPLLGGTPPVAVRQAMYDSILTLVADAKLLADPAGPALLWDLASLGFEGHPLRDALANHCRAEQAAWPDHAALLKAIGISDEKVPLREAKPRWERFQLLAKERFVWHESFGLGQVQELDPLLSQVEVNFAKRQRFTLAQALGSLAVMRPDAPVAKWMKGTSQKFDTKGLAPEFDKQVAAAFVPALPQPQNAVEAMLVPRVLTKRAYDDWRKVASVAAAAASKTRAWNEARSLHELIQMIEPLESLNASPADLDKLKGPMLFAALRPAHMESLAQSLAMLAQRLGDPKALVGLLAALPAETVCWANPEAFAATTIKLSWKLAGSWLMLTCLARGADQLIPLTLGLPLRYWTPAEEALRVLVGEDAVAQLEDQAVSLFHQGEASADTVVWLWKRKAPRIRAQFETPTPVFRSLAREVRGEYIKAYKDLHKLLLENKEFQEAMMDGGSETGIKAFVRQVKMSPVLNSGEQTSLLVKIVRIYPEAKTLVEEKSEVVSARPMVRVTSQRSYEVKREELAEILNKKIPANSEQISHARALGDLRENFEFKAAKENQRLLAARRAELERDLHDIQPTDFHEVEVTNVVVPGAEVDLTIDGKVETYTILGLWDSDPDKRYLSFDAPLGRRLLGKHVGSQLKTPDGRDAVVTAIRPLPPALKAWLRVHEH